MDDFIDIVGGMFAGLLQMFSRMDGRTQVRVANTLTKGVESVGKHLRREDVQGYNNFDNNEEETPSPEDARKNLMDASNKLNKTLITKFGSATAVALAKAKFKRGIKGGRRKKRGKTRKKRRNKKRKTKKHR